MLVSSAKLKSLSWNPLASPAALTMIRMQHDGGGVTGHQGFTEATDRYTTSPSPRVLVRFTSVRSTLPRLHFFLRGDPSLLLQWPATYVAPVCKWTLANRLFILLPIYNLSA